MLSSQHDSLLQDGGGRGYLQWTNLGPDTVFLNHGSFGVCLRPVFEEYQRGQLELERQPVKFLGRGFDYPLRRHAALGGCVEYCVGFLEPGT